MTIELEIAPLVDSHESGAEEKVVAVVCFWSFHKMNIHVGMPALALKNLVNTIASFQPSL